MMTIESLRTLLRIRIVHYTAVFLAFPVIGYASSPVFMEQPRVAANSNRRVPQAAVVTFTSDRAVSTTLTVSAGEDSWELRYGASRYPAIGLPLIGLLPATKHRIMVTIRDSAGNAATAREALEFVAPPPSNQRENFPPIRVTINKRDQLEPGYVLFNPRRRKPGRGNAGFGADFGMLLIVDYTGRPRWYYHTDSRISDFEIIGNGNIVYVTQDYRLIETDWLGNTVRHWYAAGRPDGPVPGGIRVEGTKSFHHEIDELPNGNLVVLGSEIREIDNYYTDENDEDAPRKRQKVMGDVILEFKPDTGRVVWSWKAFDHMDPFRIGYETFSGYWERRGFPGVIDWSHANNLLYDNSDDSLIVNFRYQAAAVKIDRQTKAIKWIFGEPTGWGDLSDRLFRAVGDLKWPYHHHSPTPTPDGTLLVFDNGNYQARPFTPAKPRSETYSRAVEYRLDETNLTASEIWNSEGPGPMSVLSVAMGDVEWLPKTQNVLVAYGMLTNRRTARGRPPRGGQLTRLRQYRRSQPAEVLWELLLHDPSEEDPISWALFGAEHIPSLQVVAAGT